MWSCSITNQLQPPASDDAVVHSFFEPGTAPLSIHGDKRSFFSRALECCHFLDRELHDQPLGQPLLQHGAQSTSQDTVACSLDTSSTEEARPGSACVDGAAAEVGSSSENHGGKGDRKGEYNLDSSALSKKNRVIWTAELHACFLGAIKRVGIDQVVPKTILQAMGVSGVSRESIASHLQKFRIWHRKMKEQGVLDEHLSVDEFLNTHGDKAPHSATAACRRRDAQTRRHHPFRHTRPAAHKGSRQALPTTQPSAPSPSATESLASVTASVPSTTPSSPPPPSSSTAPSGSPGTGKASRGLKRPTASASFTSKSRPVSGRGAPPSASPPKEPRQGSLVSGQPDHDAAARAPESGDPAVLAATDSIGGLQPGAQADAPFSLAMSLGDAPTSFLLGDHYMGLHESMDVFGAGPGMTSMEVSASVDMGRVPERLQHGKVLASSTAGLMVDEVMDDDLHVFLGIEDPTALADTTRPLAASFSDMNSSHTGGMAIDMEVLVRGESSSSVSLICLDRAPYHPLLHHKLDMTIADDEAVSQSLTA